MPFVSSLYSTCINIVNMMRHSVVWCQFCVYRWVVPECSMYFGQTLLHIVKECLSLLANEDM